jgi:hypothetical protein
MIAEPVRNTFYTVPLRWRVDSVLCHRLSPDWLLQKFFGGPNR